MAAFFKDEPAGERVARILGRVADGRERAVVSRVNLAELGCVLARRNAARAVASIEQLQRDGVVPWPCEGSWQEAARLRARFPRLSLADAFAAATARETKGTLLVLLDEGLLEACRAERIGVREV
ncbi:MAG: PIN domain-containing protein [Halobacteriales archaeon]|nr:PIN domain-containing protein [Halobacteriales archaeon]